MKSMKTPSSLQTELLRPHARNHMLHLSEMNIKPANMSLVTIMGDKEDITLIENQVEVEMAGSIRESLKNGDKGKETCVHFSETETRDVDAHGQSI